MIVPFDITHVKEVSELERLCFTDAWSEKALAESLENQFSHFFVYIESGKVVGYIGLYVVCSEGSITNVATHPEYRNKGIAHALISRVISLGKELGLEYITLEVRQSNLPARRLYEKCGFVEMGIRKGFYSRPVEDAVIMNYLFDKDNTN